MATSRTASRKSVLPPATTLSPERLVVAYYERSDERRSFYLLLGIPNQTPAIAVAGNRSETGSGSLFGGGKVYIKDDLKANPRDFENFIHEGLSEYTPKTDPKETGTYEGLNQTFFGDKRRIVYRRPDPNALYYELIGAWDPFSRNGMVRNLPLAFSPQSAAGRQNLGVIWETAVRLAKKSPQARMSDNGVPNLLEERSYDPLQPTAYEAARQQANEMQRRHLEMLLEAQAIEERDWQTPTPQEDQQRLAEIEQTIEAELAEKDRQQEERERQHYQARSLLSEQLERQSEASRGQSPLFRPSAEEDGDRQSWKRLSKFLICSVTFARGRRFRPLLSLPGGRTLSRVNAEHAKNRIYLVGEIPDIRGIGHRGLSSTFDNQVLEGEERHFTNQSDYLRDVVSAEVAKCEERYENEAPPKQRDAQALSAYRTQLRAAAHRDLAAIKALIEQHISYDYEVLLVHGRQELFACGSEERANQRGLLVDRRAFGDPALKRLFEFLQYEANRSYRYQPGAIEDVIEDISFLRIVPRRGTIEDRDHDLVTWWARNSI